MKKKVLIVEDERIIAEDIKSSLISYKYDVTGVVTNGLTALESIRNNQPDLVLMDIKLEGDLDGIETAHLISDKYNLPIVYLTANADDPTLERAKDTKPYGYIVKPYEDNDLNASLQIAFAKYEADRALFRSEANFKKLIEENSSGIAVVDQDDRILFINNAFQKFFDKSEAELLDTEFSYNLENADKFEISAENAAETKFAEVESVRIEWEGKPAHLATLKDITEHKKAQRKLERSSQKMLKLMEDIVNGLVSAIEMRDPYTAGHQRRVAELACAIGTEMQLSKDQIHGLRIASLVHDIGKIKVPAEILSKPGKLNEVEFAIMKSHAEAGYEVLKSIDFPWPIAKTVLQHHVKSEGDSYPPGIEAQEMTIEAKILGVADVVEAMSSHRPYRPAFSQAEVIQEIIEHKGTRYDPEVVDACLKVLIEDKFIFSSK